ncbi:transmembrane protease serine 9-like [Hemitrygon akajei]|uniref:transmembrane protease serine 9-like n=1 Tax=Hemitrygon akajei TaxID=2704970 RepID=UPI003BF953B0
MMQIIIMVYDPGAEIIGGHEVKPHSRPYMASLQRLSRNSKYFHYCGGALIRPNWVLTAAHCEKTIGSGQDLLAVLGAHVCSKNETSQQRLRIIRQIPITKYNKKTKKDDIMLLQLETDAKINQYVKVLNLPKRGITDMKSGTTCTVAGWGRTKTINYSGTLQEVEVEVIDRKKCKGMYRTKITQDMICIGDSEGRKNSCKGDSGGPLICDKMYTGIVSFGTIDCQYPAVYTLLTKKYIDWIRDTIGYPLKNAEELYSSRRMKNLPKYGKPEGSSKVGVVIEETTMNPSLHNPLVSLIVIFLAPAYPGAEIIGGHEVKPHSRPYMASLQIDFGNRKYGRYCGGALIRPNWVLTAAHCEITIASGQDLLAVLGAHVCSKNETSQQRLRIIRQIPITKFNNLTMKDDIMLLQLETDAKINQYVNVLNLPKGGITNMKSGTRCTVAGWGKTKINNYSGTLQEVEVKVIDRGECKDIYGSIITQDMICVGDSEGRKNACHGDSGGPLICDKMYTGIVSFGEEGCPDPQTPAVYTLLTKKYIDWIRDTICYPLKNAEELY